MPVPAPRLDGVRAEGARRRVKDIGRRDDAEALALRVRARYSPISSTRGLSKLSVVSSGNTPCWLLFDLLPVE
jgi:hypothetical protein